MDNLKSWFANKLRNLEIRDGVIDKSSLLLVFGSIRAELSSRLHSLNVEFIATRNLYFNKDYDRYRKTIVDYL